MDINSLSNLLFIVAICGVLYVIFTRKPTSQTTPTEPKTGLVDKLRAIIAGEATPDTTTPTDTQSALRIMEAKAAELRKGILEAGGTLEPTPHTPRPPHPPEPPSLQTVTRECRSAETHLRKAVEEAEACSIECANLIALADQIEKARVALLHAEVASAVAAAPKSHDWNANRRHHAAEVAAAGPVQLVAPVSVAVHAEK